MARIPYNNQFGALATVGTDVTNSTSATLINFAVAPNFATLTGSDYITLVLDAGKAGMEIVWLTVYTAAATSGTVTRAAEDATRYPAATHASGTWACDLTAYDMTLLQLPNSSKLISWGHSWGQPSATPYAVSNVMSAISGAPSDGEQWPNVLKDALGIGALGAYYKSYVVPSPGGASAVATTALDQMPADGTIDAVWYIPNGNLTAAPTNYRTLSISVGQLSTTQVLGTISISAGVNLVAGQGTQMVNMNTPNPYGTGLSTPYYPALRYATTNPPIPLQQEIYWVSGKGGTGATDPGGTVVIRYGTSYRNYCVSGSSVIGANPTTDKYGGWWTALSYSPYSRPNAAEINVTTLANIGATSLTVSPLQYGLYATTNINFKGGGLVTISTAAAVGATTVLCSGGTTGASIPAGAQGHVVQAGFGQYGLYETLSPSGVNVITHGLNDVNATVIDRVAWRETVRAYIARLVSPSWDYPTEGNFLYTNGSGTWANLATVANGQLPIAPTNWTPLGASLKIWTGTPASDSVAVSIGPAFEGGTVDIMFLALAGTSYGVAGTITVDGGATTNNKFNTSNVSTSGLLTKAVTGTITAAASAAIVGTGTNFAATDVGRVLIPASGTYPAGLIIQTFTDATHVTVSAAITVTGVACTTANYVPMVKRITGLTAGVHTITLTINSSDSVANSALILYGIGLESQNPTTPVLWCSVANTPATVALGHTTILANYNTDSSAVIGGTAVAPTPGTGTTATTEPSYGANVQFLDINPLLGSGLTTTYFLPDGNHPNALGHRLLARAMFSAIRNNFSPDQLMAR